MGTTPDPLTLETQVKLLSHLFRSLAALDDLIIHLFIILYFHSCGNKLDFHFSQNVGEFTMLELAENVKEVS
jgi:hypothetical protein